MDTETQTHTSARRRVERQSRGGRDGHVQLTIERTATENGWRRTALWFNRQGPPGHCAESCRGSPMHSATPSHLLARLLRHSSILPLRRQTTDALYKSVHKDIFKHTHTHTSSATSEPHLPGCLFTEEGAGAGAAMASVGERVRVGDHRATVRFVGQVPGTSGEAVDSLSAEHKRHRQ